MGETQRKQIIVPREVLLVEIERRCRVSGCAAKNRVGLTKIEAYVYRGFECERCKCWNEDYLSERDVPEWWEELAVTGLPGLRGEAGDGGAFAHGETVLRLSGNYRQLMDAQNSSDSE